MDIFPVKREIPFKPNSFMEKNEGQASDVSFIRVGNAVDAAAARFPSLAAAAFLIRRIEDKPRGREKPCSGHDYSGCLRTGAFQL